MKRWKQILRNLLFPPPTVPLLGVPVSAALLGWVFTAGRQEGPAACGTYALSFYITVVLCVRIPRLARNGQAMAHGIPLVHRYLTDVAFKTRASLYLSCAINLLYACLKLFFGAYYRSVWFGTLGVYYALLAAMRLLLLGHVRHSPLGAALVSELRRYRLCGAILLGMTTAQAGVVILAVWERAGFAYPGYLIYIMALYAFYAVISAGIDLVRYRKYQSPVMSAAKAVKLAAALVSMLALETAMLAQFSTAQQTAFRLRMTAITGLCVCGAVLVLAIYMLVSGTRRLRAAGGVR